MRLIDVCIPKFDDGPSSEIPASPAPKAVSSFQLPPALFRQVDEEYNVEDDDNDNADASSSREEQFFEAEDGSIEVCTVLLYLSISKIVS